MSSGERGVGDVDLRSTVEYSDSSRFTLYKKANPWSTLRSFSWEKPNLWSDGLTFGAVATSTTPLDMQGETFKIPMNLTTTNMDNDTTRGAPSSLSGLSRRSDSTATSHPRPLPTPTRPIVSPLHNLLPSAPASPPTPAPSPTPQIHRLPTWSTANENEDTFLRDARPHFSKLDPQERQRFLAEILNLCDSQQLSFVLNYVSPRLKKDPFKSLPNELCLRVCCQIS